MSAIEGSTTRMASSSNCCAFDHAAKLLSLNKNLIVLFEKMNE